MLGLCDSTHLHTARCSYPLFVWHHTSAHSQVFLPTVCVTAHICRQPDVLTHCLCGSTHLHTPDVLTHRLCDSKHLHTARCSHPPFVSQHTSAHGQMFSPTVCVTAHVCTQPDVLTPRFVWQHTSAHSQMFSPTVCMTAHICTQPDVLTHRLCDSTRLHTARCSHPPFVWQHTSAHSQMFSPHGLCGITHLHTARCSYPGFVWQHTSAHSQMFSPHGLCDSTHLHTARCSHPGFVWPHTSAHSRQMFLPRVCVTAHICTPPDVLTQGLCDSTHLHTATRCSYPGFVWQHTSSHSQMFLPRVCVTAHICTQPPDVLTRGSASHVPGTIGTRSILQTVINAFIDQLSNDLNRGTVPVLQDRLFGGRSKQWIARQIQRNNILGNLCLRRIGIDQSVQRLGCGLGRYWIRIPESQEKHFLQYI